MREILRQAVRSEQGPSVRLGSAIAACFRDAGVYALKTGMTVTQLAETWAQYLTMAEALKLTAQTFSRDVSDLSCCAA